MNNDELVGYITRKGTSLSGTLCGHGSLTGNISVKKALIVTLTAKPSLQGTVSSAFSRDIPEYAGEYVIKPEKEEQSLNTTNKMLRDDVVVKRIPYFEVSNETGYTVTIG